VCHGPTRGPLSPGPPAGIFSQDLQEPAQPGQHQLPHRFGVEGAKTLTLDLLVDGRFLSKALDGRGANPLRGTRTLVGVNIKPCDDKYSAGRSGLACAVATKRQQEVNVTTRSTTRRQGNSTWSRALHQATRVHSRKNPASTAKRVEWPLQWRGALLRCLPAPTPPLNLHTTYVLAGERGSFYARKPSKTPAPAHTTPSRSNLLCCAPHAHPLLPAAMAFVSYGPTLSRSPP
jgi:hypothetical protein